MINLLPQDKDNIRVESAVISLKRGKLMNRHFFSCQAIIINVFFFPLGFVEKEDGTCGSHEL